MSRRIAFIDEALKLQDSPYVWNSDGPRTFDCSGLVNYCLLLVGGPDWRATHNCARFWKDLPATETPKPGDLVLYGRAEHPTHVMIYWGGNPARVYGASGGNSDTLTVELAQKRGARVRFKTSVDYRPDRLGFRTLSPLDEDNAPWNRSPA